MASVVTSILLARLLGPAGRGDVAAIVALVGLVAQLGGLGIGSAATLELGRTPENAARAGGLALLFPLVFAVGSFGAVLVASAAGWTNHTPAILAIVVLWPAIQAAQINVQGAFLGLGDYRWFNGSDLALRLSSLLLVALLWLGGRLTSDQAVYALFVSESATLVVSALVYWKRHGLEGPGQPGAWLAMLKLGMRSYIIQLPAFVLMRSDVLILRAYRGAAETGVYAVAAQLGNLMWLLPQAFGHVLFSALPRRDDMAEHTIRVAAVTGWLLTALGAVGLLAGPFAIRLVFGAAFAGSYTYFVVLLPGIVALGVETVAVQYFNAEGFPIRIFWYWAAVTITNVALNFIFDARYGALAAALASTVCYVLMAGLILMRFQRITNVSLRPLFIPARNAFR